MFNTCPNCKSERIAVINSRDKETSIWRRRRCQDCEFTYSTREMMQDEYDRVQSFVKAVSEFAKIVEKSKIENEFKKLQELINEDV